MFLDTTQYRFVARAARRWREVRAEFERLTADDLLPYPVSRWYSGTWSVVPLRSPHDHGLGAREQEAVMKRNRQACPVTMQLTRMIPGNVLVGFSILEPGCEIEPHAHDDGDFICHVGLTVPQGCGIEVAGVQGGWSEGGTLAFDERLPHSAWNRGTSRRVALLFDFERRDAVA